MIPRRFILAVGAFTASGQEQAEGRFPSRPEESWSSCLTIGCWLVANPSRRLKVPT